MPPHLSPADQAEYRAYLEAPDHRAFAIAPGGAWGWVSGESDASAAEQKSLTVCQAQTKQRCVPYAVDDRTVFDVQGWTQLWAPYATTLQARRASLGSAPGQRFADLAFSDAKGAHRSVSSLKGRVAVLHFWGAWCPPCRKEMPDLQRLYAALADRKDVVFVLLQAREKFEVSRVWAEKQGVALPLYDSGSTGEADAKFRLAGGGSINDREIASRFPTTYVLDKNGLVVFSHVGPVYDWLQYESFLRDVAQRSGK
jgi:thiol-disulfide isomerase/thioredoxin